MSDERISQLSPGTTLSGTEPIPMVQNGVTVACNAGMIKAYLGTSNLASLQQTDPPNLGVIAPGNQTFYSLTTLDAAAVGAGGQTANYMAVNDSGSANPVPPAAYSKTLQVEMNLNGTPQLTGGRAAALFKTTLNSPTGNTSANLVTYGGVNVSCLYKVNDGGTGLTTTLATPNVSCSNLIMQLQTGATNYYGASGMEIDVSIATGASAVISRGLAITKLPTSQVRGLQGDAAIDIGSQAVTNFVIISGVTCTGTSGQFGGTCTNLVVGASIRVTGTLTGSATISGYVTGTQYYVLATDGVATFQLGTITGAHTAITTTAGTLTGLTFTPDWGTFGWKYGIALAASDPASWPYAYDSVMIGSTKTGQAGTGIDLSLVTFYTASMKLPGFTVDPVGNVSAANVSATSVAVAPTTTPVVDAGNVGYIVSQTGLPMMMAPSGSMANNGVITLGTAAPSIYANCYVYLPASAIVAGSAAGWYFAQFTTATAGTVFNNTWTIGTPTIPASPTPFVTTGPGAYTGVTSTQNACNCFLAGGIMGNNGSVEVDAQWTCNNTAGTKTCNIKFGGQIISSVAATTQTNGVTYALIRNRGVSNSQYGTGYHTAAASSGINSSAGTYTTVATSSTVFVVIGLTLNTATDVQVLESFSVKAYGN